MDGTIAREGNIGDEQQNKRLRLGAVSIAVGLALAVVMLKLGVSPLIRAILFVPFLVGVIGIASGLSGLCSGLASQGMRDMGQGPEQIADSATLARIRSRGRSLGIVALLTAITATALFVLVR